MTDHPDTEDLDYGIPLAGILRRGRHDPDDLPNAELSPDGHVSFVGSIWGGQDDWHQIVDMSLRLGRKRVDALLTINQAKIMRDALDEAIRAASSAFDEASHGTT